MTRPDERKTESIPDRVGSAAPGDEIWEESVEPGAARPEGFEEHDDEGDGEDFDAGATARAAGPATAIDRSEPARPGPGDGPILGQPPRRPSPDAAFVGADPGTHAAVRKVERDAGTPDAEGD